MIAWLISGLSRLHFERSYVTQDRPQLRKPVLHLVHRLLTAICQTIRLSYVELPVFTFYFVSQMRRTNIKGIVLVSSFAAILMKLAMSY